MSALAQREEEELHRDHPDDVQDQNASDTATEQAVMPEDTAAPGREASSRPQQHLTPVLVIDAVLRKLILLMGSGVFLGMCFYSIRYTQHFKDYTQEYLENYLDSPLKNLLWFLLALTVVTVAGNLLLGRDQKRAKKVLRLFLILVSGLYFLFSVIWVGMTHSQPYGDQAFLLNSASGFLVDNYDALSPGGYLGMMPHQLPLTLLLELIYRIFGDGRFIVFEFLNAAFMPLLVISGFGLVRELFDSDRVCFNYLMLMCGALQLFLYVPYVYGEIGSTTLLLLSAWQLTRYIKQDRISGLIIGVLAAGAAVMLRENSLIFLIAAGLVLLWHAICDRKVLMLAGIAGMILTVALLHGAVNQYYETVSGQPVSSGIPANAWIAMGLQDDWPGPGWYNNYNEEAWQRAGFDTQATKQLVDSDLQQRLQQFRLDKRGALGFIKNKLMSQWNEPTYGAFWINHSFAQEPAQGSFVYSVFDGGLNTKLGNFMNYLQFTIYLLFAAAMLYGLFHRQRIVDLLPVIFVLGGFLFSILWEAKSRYILPYYIFLFLYAAYGLSLLQKLTGRLIGRYFATRPERLAAEHIDADGTLPDEELRARAAKRHGLLFFDGRRRKRDKTDEDNR